MKNKKTLIGLIICIIVLAGVTGLGVVTGTFESVSGAFADIKIDVAVIVKLFCMVFFVLVLEKIIVLVLGIFKNIANRAGTVITISQSLVRYASAIIILCWGLSIIGVNVSTIVTSVGILTLVVGFGAESLIEDVITGLFMVFENQYNVGDIVEVGGFRGTVTNIGIRTTCITDPGGNVKIINNSNMKDILNRSDNSSRAVSTIQVAYDTDIERLEEIIPSMMEQMYESHKDKYKAAPVYLGVAELGDSGVTLKFVVEVSEKDIFSAQRILNRDLLIYFRKNNIEIPFPQLDVHSK
ncbi:MAG: mechanosensitive ion channel [Erysipelotrichaceae bacterium]|nr:mechanosensitive ion channel [Erysipelotrichaceae bacterium]